MMLLMYRNVKKLITDSLTPENWRYFDSKSITVLSPETFFLAQICTKSFSGWGFVQTPLGDLAALPRRPGPLAGKGEGKEGKGREGKGRKGKEGKWREAREGCLLLNLSLVSLLLDFLTPFDKPLFSIITGTVRLHNTVCTNKQKLLGALLLVSPLLQYWRGPISTSLRDRCHCRRRL